MKADVNTQHPYIQHMNDIAEQDVVVIDNVKGFPAYGEVYLAPDMLILICHEGELWVMDFNLYHRPRKIAARFTRGLQHPENQRFLRFQRTVLFLPLLQARNRDEPEGLSEVTSSFL